METDRRLPAVLAQAGGLTFLLISLAVATAAEPSPSPKTCKTVHPRALETYEKQRDALKRLSGALREFGQELSSAKGPRPKVWAELKKIGMSLGEPIGELKSSVDSALADLRPACAGTETSNVCSTVVAVMEKWLKDHQRLLDEGKEGLLLSARKLEDAHRKGKDVNAWYGESLLKLRDSLRSHLETTNEFDPKLRAIPQYCKKP